MYPVRPRSGGAPGAGQRADRTVGHGRFDLVPDGFDHAGEFLDEPPHVGVHVLVWRTGLLPGLTLAHRVSHAAGV